MKASISKRLTCLVLIGTFLSPAAVHAKETALKDESVYINMNEDGSVKDETVSDWLHIDSKGQILDVSNLSGIKNLKGKEVPSINGRIVNWNADKNDIFYEGKSSEKLPVNAEISYYLDGVKMNPSEISGRSGSIKIQIKINNSDAHMVKIGDKFRNIYTPFTALGIVNLPIDNFKNVKISSGEILSEGNNQLVSFIAFPGMKESLNLDDDLINLKLSDEFTITADAENFSMKPIYITATPKLVDLDALKNAGSLNELSDGISKMKEAANALLGGTKELMDNLYKAKDGSKSLSDGLNEASEGVLTLGKNINSNSDKLDLIRISNNVLLENKMISDAMYAKNIDTSVVSKLVTSENIKKLKKTAEDYKALGIDEILKNNPKLYAALSDKALGSKAENSISYLNGIVKEGKGALSAAMSTDIPKLKKLLAPLYPMLVETDEEKLDSSLYVINSSLGLADSLNTTLQNLNEDKLDDLLKGFYPLIGEGDEGKLSEKIKGIDTAIDAANGIKNDLEMVDSVKLNALIKGVYPIVGETDDSILAKKVALLKGILKNAHDFDTVINSINLDTFSQLINPLSSILSSNEKENMLISAIGSLKDTESKASKVINNEINSSSDFIKNSQMVATDDEVKALNNKILGSNIDNDTKKSLLTLVGLTAGTRANILANKDEVSELKMRLDNYEKILNDADVSSLINWFSKGNIDNVKPILSFSGNLNSIKGALNAADPMLIGMNESLSAENIKNIQPLLKYAANINNYKALLNGVSPYLAGIKGSVTVENLQNVKPMLSYTGNIKSIKESLSTIDPMIKGIKSSVTKDNIKNAGALVKEIGTLEKLQKALKDNGKLIEEASEKLNDLDNSKTTKKSIERLQTLFKDGENAKELISSLDSPYMAEKLDEAPELVSSLNSMKNDLTNGENILNVVKDALSENNVALANNLINDLPRLTEGVEKLSKGSQELSNGISMLYDGSQKLNSGMNEFNEEAVVKIDEKVSPKLDKVKELVEVKDEIVKLADDYKTFSGIDKNMDGKVKFIMKTEEIKSSEKKTSKKVAVTKKKKLSFLDWLKSLI